LRKEEAPRLAAQGERGMAAIYERFEMLGVHYVEIHFKATPFAGDLTVHCFKDGVEISGAAYQEAKSEYRKLWMVAR
jgi:hypothetical protein